MTENLLAGQFQEKPTNAFVSVKLIIANDKRRMTPYLRGILLVFFFFLIYVIQHCFICRPSDSTVSEDAGIGPRTVATVALTARRSNHLARSHPQRLDLIHMARSHPH